MQQKLDPNIEIDRGPTLWSAATFVGLGLILNFLIFEPSWLPSAAIVAGGVAASLSGFYDQSANSAAAGVLLGTLVLTPLQAFSRITLGFGIQGTGDTLFLTTIFSFAWLLIVLMVLVPLAYIGAILINFTRRKFGLPIGY